METYDLSQVYSLIDRYVVLTFLVKLLTNSNTKSTEEFNSIVVDIDFATLGLSDEAAGVLNNNPNIVNLKKYKAEITSLAEEASMQVFGYISQLSQDDKLSIKEYVDNKIASYLTKVSECQDTYMMLVVEIDKSTKEDNNIRTRELGKKAKVSFNTLYEYNTICQNYSNVSNYLRGMIKKYGKR